VITEQGAEIVSDDLPLDMEGIEAIVKETGILQRYPHVEEKLLNSQPAR
jgi:hypothetical protein